jgi:hypothetical protein
MDSIICVLCLYISSCLISLRALYLKVNKKVKFTITIIIIIIIIILSPYYKYLHSRSSTKLTNEGTDFKNFWSGIKFCIDYVPQTENRTSGEFCCVWPILG